MSDSDNSSGWYQQGTSDVLDAFNTSAESGLPAAGAREMLGKIGPNEISSERQPGFLRLLAHQLADFMIALLIVAAVISGLLGDLVDTIAIIVIVVVLVFRTNTTGRTKTRLLLFVLLSSTHGLNASHQVCHGNAQRRSAMLLLRRR